MWPIWFVADIDVIQYSSSVGLPTVGANSKLKTNKKPPIAPQVFGFTSIYAHTPFDAELANLTR